MSTGIKLRPGLSPLERFNAWYCDARPGWQHEYHTGVIAKDADLGMASDPKKARAVAEVRDRVNLLVDRGEITVLHERVGEGLYRYVAVRRAPERRDVG